jgi:hypothetical protein
VESAVPVPTASRGGPRHMTWLSDWRHSSPSLKSLRATAKPNGPSESSSEPPLAATEMVWDEGSALEQLVSLIGATVKEVRCHCRLWIRQIHAHVRPYSPAAQQTLANVRVLTGPVALVHDTG